MQCRTCGFTWTSAQIGICPRCALTSLAGEKKAPDARQIEGYERIHELGRGAMGVVWLARDLSLDRLVALKLLRTEAESGLAARLLREGQVVASLRHPNIIAIHSLGRTADGLFLVMDFIEGGSLQERLSHGPLPATEAARLAAKVADALAHAHEAGVLHRDLKPSNLLLDEDNGPILADFGLAAPISGSGELTLEGHVLGTPAYLAPELLQGANRASAQSDLYGLGAVLYACLTGRPPFAGDTPAATIAAVAEGALRRPRSLRPDIPKQLEAICLRCLARNPLERYVSALELQSQLEDFLENHSAGAPSIGESSRSSLNSAPPSFDSNDPAKSREDSQTPSKPEVRMLAEKADELFSGHDGPTRIKLQIAEEYCQRALAADPDNAEVWAIYSRLCVAYRAYGYDLTETRYRTAGNAAERAMQLDPASFESRFALANFYRSEDPTLPEGERLLRELAAERPSDRRVLRTLGHTLRFAKRLDEALAFYRQAHAQPGGDPLSLVYGAHTLSILGRQYEADAMIDEAIAIHPSGVAYLRKLFFLLRAHGNVAAARELSARIPLAYRRDDRGTYLCFLTWYWSREPEKALEALSLAPRDYLEDWYYTGTVAHLAGLAHRMAGRPEAARAKWRAALSVVDARLEKQSDEAALHLQKAAILACLREQDRAQQSLDSARQLLDLSEPVLRLRIATVELELGHKETVISILTDYFHMPSPPRYFPLTRAQLRVDPDYDPLRNDHRFLALLAEPEAPQSATKRGNTKSNPPF